MSPPWMPLYIADYLADTGDLSTLEHGAYLLLIMTYWQKGGLPSDDAKLSRIVRMTPAQWSKVKPSLATYFDAEWRHGRIDGELNKAAEVSAAYAARASKAANKRWAKDASSMPQALHEECLVMPILPSPSPSKKDEEEVFRTVAIATRPAIESQFEEFWKAYPSRGDRGNPKAPARKLFIAAVKRGVEPEKIVAAVQALVGFDRQKVGTEFIPQAVK